MGREKKYHIKNSMKGDEETDKDEGREVQGVEKMINDMLIM